MTEVDDKRSVLIDYTNWRGERRVRGILPVRILFGSTEWHKDEQWLLEAVDYGDDNHPIKLFALKDIHSWCSTISNKEQV